MGHPFWRRTTASGVSPRRKNGLHCAHASAPGQRPGHGGGGTWGNPHPRKRGRGVGGEGEEAKLPPPPQPLSPKGGRGEQERSLTVAALKEAPGAKMDCIA